MTYEQKRTLIAKAIIDTSKFFIKNNIIYLSIHHDFIIHISGIEKKQILEALQKEKVLRILSVPGYQWEDKGLLTVREDSNYELKLLDMQKVESLATNSDNSSKSMVTIKFDVESGIITKKDNISQAIGKNTPEYRILARFAEGERSVPFKEVIDHNDTDMRNETAKTLRKQTGLNKQQLINKKGYISLHNAVVVKEKPTKG